MGALFPSAEAYSWTPVVCIAVLFLRQPSRDAKCYKPFTEQWILKVNLDYFQITLRQWTDRMMAGYYGAVVFHSWSNRSSACTHGWELHNGPARFTLSE